MAPRSAHSFDKSGVLVRRALDLIAAQNGTLAPLQNAPLPARDAVTQDCPRGMLGALKRGSGTKWTYTPPQWMRQGSAPEGGTYGQVFLVDVAAAYGVLSTLPPSLGQYVQGAPLPRGGTLAIKIQVVSANGMRTAVRESQLHQHLAASRDPITIRPAECANPVSVVPADHVPAFYFAGEMPLQCMSQTAKQRAQIAANGVRVHITVMQNLAGVARTLDSLFKERTVATLTAAEYARIEKAAAALWLAGVYHGDMHTGNLMISPTRTYVIDFGFAVRMTAEQRGRVAAVVAGMFGRDRLANMYDRGQEFADVQRYVDQTIMGRWSNWRSGTPRPSTSGYPRYFANKTLLQRYYRFVQQQDLIYSTRAAVWGCRLPPPAEPASSTENGEIRPAKRRRSATRSPSVINLVSSDDRRPTPSSSKTPRRPAVNQRPSPSVINLVSSDDNGPRKTPRRPTSSSSTRRTGQGSGNTVSASRRK